MPTFDQGNLTSDLDDMPMPNADVATQHSNDTVTPPLTRLLFVNNLWPPIDSGHRPVQSHLPHRADRMPQPSPDNRRSQPSDDISGSQPAAAPYAPLPFSNTPQLGGVASRNGHYDQRRASAISHTTREARPATLARSATSRPSHSGQLPEDDGMREVRQQIIAIQSSNAPTAEKSRQVHALMTKQYRPAPAWNSPPALRPSSASSAQTSDQPATPTSPNSILDPAVVNSPATSCSAPDGSAIQISAEDRAQTFHTLRRKREKSQKFEGQEEGEAETVLGCKHYRRNVKLQCSTCARWHTCRFCHDDAEDHTLVRRETRNMLCMLCGAAQPASEVCRECEGIAARYYCSVCKLWDNDPNKSIYHCSDCGICRVGEGLGMDFFHCQVCYKPPLA